MKINTLVSTAVAALIALGGVVGCSSSGDSSDSGTSAPARDSWADDQADAANDAPTLDRDEALHEAWQSAVDTYSADLKLSICEAADKGGASAVKSFLTNEDEMPFVVEHPGYDAGEWVKYCAK
ncbi:hypothetical protein [Streptomyces malaysiensis]